MDFTEYQEKAFSTCTPECYTDEYLDLGYLSEVGELAGKLAKRIRGDIVSDDAIMQEIGDVAWMTAIKAHLHKLKIKPHDSVIGFGNISLPKFMDKLAGEANHNIRIKSLMILCDRLNLSFGRCLKLNNEKLASRKARGMIKGNGDNR